MTSELRVTTLSNATGDGPATLTSQIAATSLLNFQNSGSNVTHRSLNISSVVDDDTGVFNVNFTTSYNAADYVMTASAYCGGSAQATNPAVCMSTYSGAQAYSTSGCGVMAEDVDGANADMERNFMAFYGDLA